MILVVLILIIVLSIIDGSYATLVMGAGMYIMGAAAQLLFQGQYRIKSLRLYNIVFAVYFIFAYIVSLSFTVSDYFLVSDSSRYIESYMGRTLFYFDTEDLMNYYVEFADGNILYNAYLNIMAVFANNYLGGMTVFCLTLCQTIWGVLSSSILFRILVRRFPIERAFKITLLFAFCSLYMFYSTVIIRDIIICFLYLAAFDVVDQNFRYSGVLKLLVIILLAWGIRLYSGLFAVAFLAYYLYSKVRNSFLKPIATLIFVVVLIGAGGSILASDIVEQTITEMNEYAELAAERSDGGVVAKLQNLPPGLSHFAIVVFTMVRPLPPFSIYLGVETFSHFVISTMNLIAGFFWFVVFFNLCYQLFINKYILKVPFEKIVLLLVCLVFMLANASHPDIRRMMPVFPILFVQYADICKLKNDTLFSNPISKNLMIFYIVMAFVMWAIL